jgi:hypothetical protein
MRRQRTRPAARTRLTGRPSGRSARRTGNEGQTRNQDRDPERWKNYGRVTHPKKLALNLGSDTML